MSTLASRLGVACLGLLTLAACGDAATPPAKVADKAPYDLATEVTHHAGRGRPGWRFGYTVRRDGRGVVWEEDPERGDARLEKSADTLRHADVEALFRAFQDAAFTGLSLTDHDPWGSTLELVWPGGRHALSWPSATHPPELRAILNSLTLLRANRGPPPPKGD